MRQILKGTLKLKMQEMKFKDTPSGKGQAESCDPYQRQHKGQRQKERSRLKLQQLIFIHFLYRGSQQH